MSLNFGSKVRLTLGLVALFLAIVGGTAIFKAVTREDRAEWIQQAHKVIQTLQKVHADYRGIQASYAEYLLTQKESKAKACRREIGNIRADLSTARALLAGDPALQPLLSTLEIQVERKVQVAERGLELAQAGLWDLAIAELKRVDEKTDTQDIRSTINKMASFQAWMLKSRLSLEEVATHRNVRFIMVGLLFTFLVCSLAAALVVRQALARQRTIRLLRASEERAKFLIETANDAFLTLDKAGTVIEANPAAEGIFGHDRPGLLGHPVDDLLSPSFGQGTSKTRFQALLDMTLKVGLHTLELSGRRKEGVEFPAEFSISQWSGRGGTFYSLIVRDVTDRKFFVKTLLNNEHRLFQFLDAVPAGIMVRDKLGKHYYANRVARELLGKDIHRNSTPPQEIPKAYGIYKAGSQDLYPADRLPMIRALAGEKSFVDDAEIRRADRVIPIEAWGTPILDENGGLKFAFEAFMDVSRQREAAESMREREEFFRNLFEESPIGMTLSYPNSNLADVNRAFCHMAGYTKPELVGKPLHDLTHPEDMKADQALSKRLFDRTLPRYQIEKRLLTKSGDPIWCRESASVIRDAEDQPLFLLAMVENITEQREAEVALRESGERFRSLADSANDAIVSSDSKGAIVYFNPSAERIFGWPQAEALGKSIDFLMAEGSWKREQAKIQDYLTTGKTTRSDRTLELTGKRKGGAEFPAEISYFSWKTVSGLFFTAIIRDITERKQIEEMKSDLVSVVSHQLKTPVAEINGYIENLLEGLAGDLTDRQKEYLADMRSIGADNYRLITDLLSMSKIERGVMTVELQPVPLQEILEQSLRDYEAPIRKKGLELKFENAQKAALVLADRDKTVETLRNIINNAIKCTDKGSITLRTSAENGYSVVEVTDTGIGMAPEALSKVFTKERVMGQEAARAGAGLGLYIAKNFMELQKGRITVRSEKGKGTSFFISIPNHKK